MLKIVTTTRTITVEDSVEWVMERLEDDWIDVRESSPNEISLGAPKQNRNGKLTTIAVSHIVEIQHP